MILVVGSNFGVAEHINPFLSTLLTNSQQDARKQQTQNEQTQHRKMRDFSVQTLVYGYPKEMFLETQTSKKWQLNI